jgi:hypothetical protein
MSAGRDIGRIYQAASGELVLESAGGGSIPVRAVWARPLSGRGGEVSLLDKNGREVALVADLDSLEERSRAALVQSLQARYLIPRIVRILGLRAHLGVLLWTVDTDIGPRRFTTKDPETHVTRVGTDTLIIRDVTGNSYEIQSLTALDKVSRYRADLVL